MSPLVKGPMTVTGFIAFAQGWGGLYIRANKLAYKQMKKHPGLGIPNAMGIPDVPERVHWENEVAMEVGTPAAYDYGPAPPRRQRVAINAPVGMDSIFLGFGPSPEPSDAVRRCTRQHPEGVASAATALRLLGEVLDEERHPHMCSPFVKRVPAQAN